MTAWTGIQLLFTMKKSPSLFRRWRDRDREKKDQRLASPATSAAPTERLAVPEGDREKELDEVDHDRHETINSAQERQDEVDTSSCSVKDTETYHWRRTLESLEDVGQLRVHLIGASGLYGADFGGKSDPFAVVRVGDVEFTSATVAKTTEPAWDEEFLFQVDDICQILHVSVWDRDRFHDPELLGRVALSLLEIKEDDEKGTVSTLSLALKDKKLSGRARGRHPQIRLGLRLTWNRGRAAIRTLFRPELQPPAPPFKKHVFIGNVQRVRRLLHAAEQFAKFIQSCFEWEHPSRSIKAFGAFEVAAYFFEAYMVPLAFLVFIFGYPLFAAKFAVVDWLDPYSELVGRVVSFFLAFAHTSEFALAGEQRRRRGGRGGGRQVHPFRQAEFVRTLQSASRGDGVRAEYAGPAGVDGGAHQERAHLYHALPHVDCGSLLVLRGAHTLPASAASPHHVVGRAQVLQEASAAEAQVNQRGEQAI